MMKFAARNYGARGPMVSKDVCIHLIEGVPELYVSDGNVHLEHTVPVTTGGFENCVHVVECPVGLFLDRSELLLTGCRIDRKLAGNEDQAVVNSCLRVMARGLRRVWGIYSFNFHNSNMPQKP